MKLYIHFNADSNSYKLVKSPNDNSVVVLSDFVRGDILTLELHLLELGLSRKFVDGDKLRVALSGDKGKVLAYADTYEALVDGGVNIVLALNTVEVSQAVAKHICVDVLFEVELTTAAGDRLTILQCPTKLRNSVLQNQPIVNVVDRYYKKEESDKKFVTKTKLPFGVKLPHDGFGILPTDAVLGISEGDKLCYVTRTCDIYGIEYSEGEYSKVDFKPRVLFSASGLAGISSESFVPFFYNIFGSVYEQAWHMKSEAPTPRTYDLINSLWILPNPDFKDVKKIFTENTPCTAHIHQSWASTFFVDEQDHKIQRDVAIIPFAGRSLNIEHSSTSFRFVNLQTDKTENINIPPNTYALIQMSATIEILPRYADIVGFDGFVTDENNAIISEKKKVILAPIGLSDQHLAELYPNAHWSRYNLNDEDTVQSENYGNKYGEYLLIPDWYEVGDSSAQLHEPSDFELEISSEDMNLFRYGDFHNQSTNFTNNDGVIKIGFEIETLKNARPFILVRGGTSGSTLVIRAQEGTTAYLGLDILTW